MFLKLFEPILIALQKNVKVTLLAILLAGLIYWGLNAEERLIKEAEKCAEERRADKEMIKNLSDELKDNRERLFDAFMLQQLQRESVKHNDSIINNQVNQALRKIKP